MCGKLTVDDGKHHGNSGAVVAAERCTVGAKPAVLNAYADTVAQKIVRDAFFFLAYHVHMPLKHDRSLMLASRSGGNTHENIVAAVAQAKALAVRGKFFDPLCHRLFVSRSARYRGYFFKKLKHAARLKSFGHIFHISHSFR